jgi:plasmid stabilization system protein ParE
VAELVWEVDALNDLDLIGEYIAQQSPAYAPTYVARVMEAVERLADLPLSGRVIPELGDETLREVIFQNYRIVYEVAPDQVTILGVVHAALDFAGIARARSWYLT